MLGRFFLLAGLLAAAVLADNPTLNTEATSTEADVPPGVVVMTSIQGILLQPKASAITKNDVAVGNNVLISKSNVGVAAGNDKERLVQRIEELVLASGPGSEETTAKVISDLIGPATPKSSGESDGMAEKTRQKQIRALFLLRSNRARLRGTIIAIVALIPVQPSASSTLLGQKKMAMTKNPETEQFFGTRVLFRYPFQSSWRFGWRYPLSYWNLYGAALYPGTCGFGVALGPFFYC